MDFGVYGILGDFGVFFGFLDLIGNLRCGIDEFWGGFGRILGFSGHSGGFGVFWPFPLV